MNMEINFNQIYNKNKLLLDQKEVVIVILSNKLLIMQ